MWDCFDCMALVCTDCHIEPWNMGEDFYVNDGLWYLTLPKIKWESVICIGCFEKRLGRKLARKDFKLWFRNNRCWGNQRRKLNDPPSDRLADRLKLKA